MGICGAVIGNAQTTTAPLYQTNFETSGSGRIFTAGSIGGQHQWSVKSGVAEICNPTGQGYCLQLSPSAAPNSTKGSAELSLTGVWGSQQVPNSMHIDFCIRPVPVTQSTANEGVYSVDGAWFGWFLDPSNANEAELWLYDGNGTGGGTWVRTGNKIQKIGGFWPMKRLAVRQDYARQTFDVATSDPGVPPVMGGADFGFKNFPVNKTEVVFAVGTASGNVHIDDLTITSVNPGGTDQDNDGMLDSVDTNPGLDNRDLDSDGDGMTDLYEYLHASNAEDGDTLSYLQESMYGTNPYQTDTDGDGVNDSAEVANGTDPRDAADSTVTVDDCMQNLTIEIGGDAPSGVTWTATVEERVPGGGTRLRFSVVAGNSPVQQVFKCRAAAQYQVCLKRSSPGSTTADKPRFLVSSAFICNAPPQSSSMPTQPASIPWVKIEDPFALLRTQAQQGTGLSSSAMQATQPVYVVGLDPVRLETSGPNGSLLASRFDRFLLQEAVNGTFGITVRKYSSRVHAVLQTSWPLQHSGTATVNAEPNLANGETVAFRNLPSPVPGSVTPRIQLRDVATQLLTGSATAEVSTIQETPVPTGASQGMPPQAAAAVATALLPPETTVAPLPPPIRPAVPVAPVVWPPSPQTSASMSGWALARMLPMDPTPLL